MVKRERERVRCRPPILTVDSRWRTGGGSIPMVQVVYEVDRRWWRTLELGFRPVTISHSRSGFKTMSPATCHPGYALR
ncbi:hypothetical protein Hdeb2414_s0202g00831101 [Helianthus debilis subsp. tardiflorus]